MRFSITLKNYSLAPVPFTGRHADFAGEDAGEDGGGGETCLFAYFLDLHIRVLRHQTLCLFDAVARDKLIEITAVLIVDELAQIRPIHRQNMAQVEQSEVSIGIGFFLLQPCLQRFAVFGVRAGGFFFYFFWRAGYGRFSCLFPRVFTEQDLLRAITDHEDEEPLVGESSCYRGIETIEDVQDTVDDEHNDIPYDPLYFDIFHGGVVLFTPFSILIDTSDKKTEQEQGVDRQQDTQVQIEEHVQRKGHGNRQTLQESPLGGEPSRTQLFRRIQQHHP